MSTLPFHQGVRQSSPATGAETPPGTQGSDLTSIPRDPSFTECSYDEQSGSYFLAQPRKDSPSAEVSAIVAAVSAGVMGLGLAWAFDWPIWLLVAFAISAFLIIFRS